MIIVFGGSFDPPHLGHVNIVKKLLETYPLAYKVLIVPNSISPFKNEKSLSKESIWELCELSFKGFLDERVSLSDHEIWKNGESYTVDTIQKIESIYNDKSIYLCIGEDSLATLKDWHEFSLLDSLIDRYIIIRRKTKAEIPLTFPSVSVEAKSEVLSNDLWDVSSTRLRNERDLEYSKRWMNSECIAFLKGKDWFH